MVCHGERPDEERRERWVAVLAPFPEANNCVVGQKKMGENGSSKKGTNLAYSYDRLVLSIIFICTTTERIDLFFLNFFPSIAVASAGMGSGLEAFSHDPTEGSVAATAFRPTAKTGSPNRRFLSY